MIAFPENQVSKAKRGRAAARALLVVLGALTCGVLGLAFAVDRFGQKDRARRAQAIVVLGARVLEDGTPSDALKARAERAAELYRQGLAPLVVFSGGVGRYPPAEALAARDHALTLGIPPAACAVETDSHSTAENAAFTARVLRARGLSEAILVSDPYHLLRARQYFWRAGVRVLPSPALLSGRNLSLPERCYWTVREAFALLLHPALWFAREPPPSPPSSPAP
jgi:uncharacterized SAM-binding protein YcdF (DUF218 family)